MARHKTLEDKLSQENGTQIRRKLKKSQDQ